MIPMNKNFKAKPFKEVEELLNFLNEAHTIVPVNVCQDNLSEVPYTLIYCELTPKTIKP